MKLTVAVIQMPVAGGDPQKNLGVAKDLVQEAAQRGAKLLVLPEMWTTGFNWTRNKELLAEYDNAIKEVCAWANKLGVWINGSYLHPNREGKAANTSILMDPEGQRVAKYEKTHLFRKAEEHLHITPGEELTLANTPWGKVGLSICYDVRFCEIFRFYSAAGARMILHPAAFPHPRLEHWQVLNRARAIENQLFFLTANYVGKGEVRSEGQVEFFGHSMIIDPWGNVLALGSEDRAEVLVKEIDLSQIEVVREKIEVFKDRKPKLYRKFEDSLSTAFPKSSDQEAE